MFSCTFWHLSAHFSCFLSLISGLRVFGRRSVEIVCHISHNHVVDLKNVNNIVLSTLCWHSFFLIFPFCFPNLTRNKTSYSTLASFYIYAKYYVHCTQSMTLFQLQYINVTCVGRAFSYLHVLIHFYLIEYVLDRSRNFYCTKLYSISLTYLTNMRRLNTFVWPDWYKNLSWYCISSMIYLKNLR